MVISRTFSPGNKKIPKVLKTLLFSYLHLVLNKEYAFKRLMLKIYIFRAASERTVTEKTYMFYSFNLNYCLSFIWGI